MAVVTSISGFSATVVTTASLVIYEKAPTGKESSTEEVSGGGGDATCTAEAAAAGTADGLELTSGCACTIRTSVLEKAVNKHVQLQTNRKQRSRRRQGHRKRPAMACFVANLMLSLC